MNSLNTASPPVTFCLHPFGAAGSWARYKTRPISPGGFEFGAIPGSLWIFRTQSAAVTRGGFVLLFFVLF